MDLHTQLLSSGQDDREYLSIGSGTNALKSKDSTSELSKYAGVLVYLFTLYSAATVPIQFRQHYHTVPPPFYYGMEAFSQLDRIISLLTQSHLLKYNSLSRL